MRNNNLRSIFVVSREQSERDREPGVGDRGNREDTACLGLYSFAKKLAISNVADKNLPAFFIIQVRRTSSIINC